MLSRRAAIKSIFAEHGDDCIYVTSTGYISRAVHQEFREKKNIFYMQGSMGLAPAIGIGIASSQSLPVVVISGDAALLMHLGLTHSIRDLALPNLFVYVLDNGCHESVGSYYAPPLETRYEGVTKILKISRDGKCPRVEVTPVKNAEGVKSFIQNAQ